MPKVKMSDVKSGSENVKNVFRRTMDMRTLGWFKKQKYTNDELLEIMNISISIERHKDHRYLYQRLIESQTGPFNREVFVAFRDLVFHTESLLNLIRYSEGITDADKAKWIDYAILTSSYWFIPNFFIKSAGKPRHSWRGWIGSENHHLKKYLQTPDIPSNFLYNYT